MGASASTEIYESEPTSERCVGEHSDTWNAQLHIWLLLYNCTRTIEARFAPEPWGPWSPPVVMLSNNEPLLGSVRMAGLWADAQGLIIDPAFPPDWGTFAWRSQAFSVERAQSEMRDHVTAAGNDNLAMRVRVPQNTSQAALTGVNCRPTPFTYHPDTNFVQFSLPVAPDVEATWSVQTGG
jgi:hypothetical protein